MARISDAITPELRMHAERCITPRRLLLIEDSADFAEYLKIEVEQEDFWQGSDRSFADTRWLVHHVPARTQALSVLGSSHIDLIVCDLQLDDESGLDLVLDLRKTAGIQTPIVILTSMPGQDIELIGLENGADYYVLKHESPAILSARLRTAFLRGQAKNVKLNLGPLTIDLEAGCATCHSRLLPLTPKSLAILTLLVLSAPESLGAEDCHRFVWRDPPAKWPDDQIRATSELVVHSNKLGVAMTKLRDELSGIPFRVESVGPSMTDRDRDQLRNMNRDEQLSAQKLTQRWRLVFNGFPADMI